MRSNDLEWEIAVQRGTRAARKGFQCLRVQDSANSLSVFVTRPPSKTVWVERHQAEFLKRDITL